MRAVDHAVSVIIDAVGAIFELGTAGRREAAIGIGAIDKKIAVIVDMIVADFLPPSSSLTSRKSGTIDVGAIGLAVAVLVEAVAAIGLESRATGAARVPETVGIGAVLAVVAVVVHPVPATAFNRGSRSAAPSDGTIRGTIEGIFVDRTDMIAAETAANDAAIDGAGKQALGKLANMVPAGTSAASTSAIAGAAFMRLIQELANEITAHCLAILGAIVGIFAGLTYGIPAGRAAAIVRAAGVVLRNIADGVTANGRHAVIGTAGRTLAAIAVKIAANSRRAIIGANLPWFANHIAAQGSGIAGGISLTVDIDAVRFSAGVIIDTVVAIGFNNRLIGSDVAIRRLVGISILGPGNPSLVVILAELARGIDCGTPMRQGMGARGAAVVREASQKGIDI